MRRLSFILPALLVCLLLLAMLRQFNVIFLRLGLGDLLVALVGIFIGAALAEIVSLFREDGG